MKPVMHVFAFDTYDDMINSNDLHTNCLVFTLGKNQPGDGQGDIYYLIENEKVNKYTSIGELLRTDNMFRASKIELGPEVNARRIAEDAKYHTRSLMNSTSSNFNNRMDEALSSMEEVKQNTISKYYEVEERLRAKNILLENTVSELLSRVEFLESKLGITSEDSKKTTTSDNTESPVTEHTEVTNNNQNTDATPETTETNTDNSKVVSEENETAENTPKKSKKGDK